MKILTFDALIIFIILPSLFLWAWILSLAF